MISLHDIKENSVIVIAGPTASGKSALALEIAKQYGGEIVNADSMQVYQGTSILSAAPGVEDKSKVLHHLYEIYPPSVNGTVVDWLDRAVAVIRDVWKRGKLPIVVGGTGMYIDNLINGTTPIPEPLPEIREKVLQILANGGQQKLYECLKVSDPAGAEMLNPNDTTRVRRALEIFLQTGISIKDWYKKPLLKKMPEAVFEVVKIIPSAEELDDRCYRRFDLMMQKGALEEVRYLQSLNLDKNMPAMKMLGVPELLSYLQGETTLPEAVEAAKLHTRQYAKRQRTWFRNKLRARYIFDKCFI